MFKIIYLLILSFSVNCSNKLENIKSIMSKSKDF